MGPAWDDASLRAWFEARAGEDVLETELLRLFFPEDPLGPVSLDLFQKHFHLYRRLFLLDDTVRKQTGHRLWIRSIRCTWLEPPAPGTCGWLDPETGVLCPQAAALCPHRAEGQLERPALRSYYLDERNAADMTEEALEELMRSFGRWLENPEETAAALVTLGLDDSADGRAIKARWRELSRRHHPDVGGDPELYQRLSAAWTVLKFRTGPS